MILSTGGGVCSRGGAWPQGGSGPGGVPAPGLVPGPGRGCLVETPPTATAAGGTHPTGMHSCCMIFDVVRIKSNKLFTHFSASPHSIDQLDVEESKNCYFDSLRVFDGETNDTLLFGPLCGQLNETPVE